MNSGRLGLILVIGVIFIYSACTGANVPPLIDTPFPATIDPAAIFSSNCASCHGADRSGKRGPSLLPDRLAKEAPQYAETITNGSGPMPAFKGKLSSEEINTLADWILTPAE
jgi:mono/diheme cytochrome c family protein